MVLIFLLVVLLTAGVSAVEGPLALMSSSILMGGDDCEDFFNFRTGFRQARATMPLVLNFFTGFVVFDRTVSIFIAATDFALCANETNKFSGASLDAFACDGILNSGKRLFWKLIKANEKLW